ncbi:MAG: 5'-nucleotidase C-terminal domain-containing protein [Gemmatimonadota bacterium]
MGTTRVLLAAWLTLTWAGPAMPAGTETLTVLHTNDMVGRLGPGPYYDEVRGGMARLVRLLRAANADSQALVLDGGNALGPDPISQMDAGRFFVSLMDSAGYTALVPGNHGLNYGPDTLRARAREAGFPFLAANVTAGGAPLLAASAVVQRAGLRILLTGAVSSGVSRVLNPLRARGLAVTDPVQAVAQVLAAVPPDSVDLVIALAYMPTEEALQLARALPRLNLIIAGDTERAPLKGGTTHLVELVSGTRIASTPGEGAAVGRLDLDLVRDAAGRVVIRDVRASLLPVTEDLPEDPEIVRLIEEQEWLFARAGERPVARLRGEVPESRQFLAEVMRRSMRAEVGILNYGAIRPIRLSGEVHMAHIDTLVRFDDILVRIAVSGARLKQLAADAAGRDKPGQKLAFSGYDPATQTIGGVPVEDGEAYSAATTAYLAGGGDGYFSPATYAGGVAHPELSLRDIAVGYLEAHPDPLARLAATRAEYRTWKATSRVTGSLTFTELNSRARRYGGISTMGGRNALAWNTSINSRLTRNAVASLTTADLRTSYGRVRQDGGSLEAADRISVDVVYTRREPKPSPFVAANATTVWTVPEAQDRPLTLRGSAGLSTRLGQKVTTRLGLGLERDFAAQRNQLGLEVAPEARLAVARGNTLNTSGKVFIGATEPRRLSAEWYNSLAISLRGNLRATVDANLFFHWDSKVDRVGLKSEMQMGVAYAWDGRWVP